MRRRNEEKRIEKAKEVKKVKNAEKKWRKKG